MEDDLKINFIEAFKRLKLLSPMKRPPLTWGVLPGVPTLLMERIMYAEKGKPVELVNTIYEPTHTSVACT